MAVDGPWNTPGSKKQPEVIPSKDEIQALVESAMPARPTDQDAYHHWVVDLQSLFRAVEMCAERGLRVTRGAAETGCSGSGDPANCPENEGRGCCKPNPVAWRRLIDGPYEKRPRYGYSEEAFEGGTPLYEHPAPETEGYPGIAHDFEQMRLKLRDAHAELRRLDGTGGECRCQFCSPVKSTTEPQS